MHATTVCGPGGAGQTIPHDPQFVVDVVAVSQPFAIIPSQLPYPALQAPSPHALVEHTGVAFGATQMFPHAPQFATPFVVLVSQPSDAFPLQLANPALHVNPQLAPLQLGIAFAADGHAVQDDPQVATSLDETHAPEHAW